MSFKFFVLFLFQTLMQFLMVFHVPTIIYAFLWNITPYMVGEYGPWTVYYFNVILCFMMMNMVANWLCVILYDPSYPKTKDNPFLVSHDVNSLPDHFIPLIEQNQTNQNGLNGHCVYDMTTKERLPWEYCDTCEMHIPPRAHHCKVCKKCILKRDHHCYLVGNCVGFKNQRYFIMMNFYLMAVGFLAGFWTFRYVQLEVWPELSSWSELLFPVSIIRCMFGYTKVSHALLIFHAFTEPFFGFIGFVYFTSQVVMSADGKTLYEVVKKVPIKNKNTINTNMKSIFGDCWVLNFLFPMTLIFRQRDDGIHWDNIKIVHTQREKAAD